MANGSVDNTGAGYVGAVFVLGYITAGMAFVGAVAGLITGNIVGMGVCLLASALASGLLANAALRD